MCFVARASRVGHIARRVSDNARNVFPVPGAVISEYDGQYSLTACSTPSPCGTLAAEGSRLLAKCGDGTQGG
jgi:hypothetical protein